MKPGTVSLEKCTNRSHPPAIAASSTLNVLMMLLPKTTCGGVVDRLRDRRRVDDDVAARDERVRGARVGQVGLPVVLRLARVDAVPDRAREIARPHVVARLVEARDERAADLAVGAGDEDPHRSAPSWLVHVRRRII